MARWGDSPANAGIAPLPPERQPQLIDAMSNLWVDSGERYGDAGEHYTIRPERGDRAIPSGRAQWPAIRNVDQDATSAGGPDHDARRYRTARACRPRNDHRAADPWPIRLHGRRRRAGNHGR